ncbi:type II secretion system F family protein [Arthrobacter sp. TMT4-20]
MTGFAVGGLMLVAFLILAVTEVRREGQNNAGEPTGVGYRIAATRNLTRPAQVAPSELPLFVYQLTALLQAGRAPHQLWQDMTVVYSAAGRERIPGSGPGFEQVALPVVRAAQQAAAIGAGIPEVLRRAAADPHGRERWRLSRVRTPPADCSGMWRDLAVCLEVSERSGAPLVEVLGRYAAQLEQSLSAAASRATALAGPAATARLLGWLPIFGLGLGYLTGAQPLAILFGSLPGLVLLCTGSLLMVGGRVWSNRLVAAAARDG